MQEYELGELELLNVIVWNRQVALEPDIENKLNRPEMSVRFLRASKAVVNHLFHGLVLSQQFVSGFDADPWDAIKVIAAC
jgi:hypothetical protein